MAEFGHKHPIFRTICDEVAKAANIEGAEFGAMPFDMGHKFGVAITLPNGARHAVRGQSLELLQRPDTVIEGLANVLQQWAVANGGVVHEGTETGSD